MLLAIMADLGIPVPLVVKPALFLIVYQAGPISLPVLLFIGSLQIGRQIGAAILYWSSRLLGNRFLDWINRHHKRLGKQLTEKEGEFKEKLGEGTQRNVRIVGTITFGRLTPGLLPVVTIGAGMLKLSYLLLVIAVVISAIIYDAVTISLGFLAKIGLYGVSPDIAVWIILGVAILVAGLPTLISFLAGRKKKQGS